MKCCAVIKNQKFTRGQSELSNAILYFNLIVDSKQRVFGHKTLIHMQAKDR